MQYNQEGILLIRYTPQSGRVTLNPWPLTLSLGVGDEFINQLEILKEAPNTPDDESNKNIFILLIGNYNK